MSKEPMVVSFSGGQTSAFMCDFLMQNYADAYEFHFVFANTGREHEETLIFADKVDKLLVLTLSGWKGLPVASMVLECVTALSHSKPHPGTANHLSSSLAWREYLTYRVRNAVTI